LTKSAEHFKRISHSILNLPTLPTVAARLIDLVDNPKTSATQVGKLISEDQVLTARILKMCNSAYYGLGRDVTSVQQAIVLLGFDNVRELSLSVSVINAFRNVQGSSLLDINSFWDHCGYVGIASRFLAKRYAPGLAGEAFTAGLLHDIGKVVLMEFLGKEFSKVLDINKERKEELYLLEREILGVDHGEIGFWLGEKWKLPPNLCAVMQHHHHPEEEEEHQELVCLVALADLFVRIMKKGYSGNPAPPKISAQLIQCVQNLWGLTLEPELLKDMVQDLILEIESSASLSEDLLQ